MEAEVAYFVEQCDLLTDEMKDQLRQEFMTMLHGRNICVEDEETVCDIGEVEINCGNVIREDESVGGRVRRSSNMEELRIKFKVKIENVTQDQYNCSAKCSLVDMVRTLCIQKCVSDFEASRTQLIANQTSKVRELFQDVQIDTEEGPDRGRGGLSGARPSRPTAALRVGGLVLMPKEGFTGSDAVTSCGRGMSRSNGLCGKSRSSHNTFPAKETRLSYLGVGMYSLLLRQ